jgi:periplasmic protein CpxP/Spy
MKKASLFIVMLSFAFASAAQQPNGDRGGAATPPQSQQDQQMQMQMQQMQQMEGRMQAMRALMERIQNTKDPEERQRLLDEHAQSMQQGMMTMGRMMPGPGGGQRQGEQCAETDAACQMQRMQDQQQMMGQHMGMMRMMMEQMMGQMVQREAQPQTGETPAQQNHDAHH